ncbi:MAG: UPF0182 family protein [Gemmatimonadetes bacterium]|nr:UPF0182 family protein [Gemmatimonadota bacterium]
MNRRITVIAFVLGFFFLFIGFPTLIGLTADWWWFQSIGYQTVFLKQAVTQTALALGVGAIALGFFYGNLRFAQRGLVPPVLIGIQGQTPPIDVTRVFRRLVWPASIVLAVILGLAATGAWLTVLRFLYRVPFGVTDPVFQRELSYYFFTMPALSALIGLVSALTVLSLVMVTPVYLLRSDVVLRGGRVTIEPSAQLHLALLLAVYLLTMAVNLYLVRVPSLLYSTTGDRFTGASYADLHARLPLLRILGAVAVAGAGLIVWGGIQRRLVRYFAIALGGYFAMSVLSSVVPGLVQRFVVLPNELARETPQLKHHIAATQRAWGLDSIQLHDLSGEAELTLRDIRANTATIENVRLWDREPLLQTFGQLQEIRTYYDFVSVDDDRYWINGRYRQVLLSPRELNSASLPTRNFINERLTFTHGMGLTLGPVNQVTVEGLPVLFIKDLPPASSVSLPVTRPAIYYGELSSDYVFVGTGQAEFDYPSGEANTYTKYDGKGGVPVRSWMRRLLLSIHFGSTNVLFSKDINNQSQVLFHRNIRERARTALPFLRWDNDPYMVIQTDGRLAWILDAYTTSNRYPYAQPLGDGTNYMRNSVKLVIDAYDGTLEAYLAGPDDPLIRSYSAMFPGVFRPLSAMPEDLRAHVRYPEDFFHAQAVLYTTYHMNEPDVFFHREDQWQIPAASDNNPRSYLRHMVMRLPGEKQEEYIEMTPFTPRGKDNLAAWMAVRNDGDGYGHTVVYRFPRQSLVFGPTQILNRINQDTEISQQVTLWDQSGSRVIRGNLLVIPIEGALLFVQALYLQAQGGRIPELKRVIVAYKNQVAMEETLEASLARLFGGAPGTAPAREQAPAPAPVAGAPVAALAQQAVDHYDRAIAAQRIGDWATYGTEMRQVGELLKRIREEGRGKREE